MILIILFGIAFFVSCCAREDNYGCWQEGWGAYFPWIFITLFFISVITCCYINHLGIAEYQQITKKELVALRDKDGISGNFFLGGGRIGDKQYYFYYEKLSNGSFTANKIDASGVAIYEEDRQDAVLLVYEVVLKNGWWWFVTYPSHDPDGSIQFYVPKGTIRRGFSI